MSILALATNESGRDYVVGDLHGGYDALMRSLEEIGFDHNADRLISVGDLVDRGPDSMGCFCLLDEPWFYACLGNHEQMMMEALSAGLGSAEALLWFRNGGDWSLDYDWQELTRGVLQRRARLPDAIEVCVGSRRVGVIHAEVPGHDWSRLAQSLETEEGRHEALWSRATISRLSREPGYVPWVDGIDRVIVGHTPLEEPLSAGNLMYIDTGAFLERGYLTVVRLEEVLARESGHRPRR
ncbi:serine/threonine protein phosphatase, partial [Tamilnaduibacter salinus]